MDGGDGSQVVGGGRLWSPLSTVGGSPPTNAARLEATAQGRRTDGATHARSEKKLRVDLSAILGLMHKSKMLTIYDRARMVEQGRR